MNIKSFLKNNGIRKADAVIVKKEPFGILDHYVIFGGYDNVTDEPIFIANNSAGVHILPTFHLLEFLKTYTPVSIKRFVGSEIERNYAIERVKAELNSPSRKAYNLIINNCEHFANWVQTGIKQSEQVKDFGTVTALGGIGVSAIGIASKNETMVWTGLALTLLGGITASLSEE